MKSSDWNPYPQRRPLQHKQFLLWVRRPRSQWPTFEIGYWDGEKFLAIRDKYVLASSTILFPLYRAFNAISHLKSHPFQKCKFFAPA